MAANSQIGGGIRVEEKEDLKVKREVMRWSKMWIGPIAQVLVL